jgi:hypothetical protein
MSQREKRSDGIIRPKRADTLIGSIERQYKIDLGVRSDQDV